uniref:Ribosomal protein S13 n=1 Tax=Malawimonas californiana TaxID=221722 RepID=A0A0B5GNN1_MALCL|nr:ribosomal protein S13 [Malawimonas californiana]AJF22874.1 ribosomal protein S13 [Malawimonas californiana]
MLLIFNTNIPNKCDIRNGLAKIKGIGFKTADIICNSMGIGKYYTFNQLTYSQINRLVKNIQNNLNILNKPNFIKDFKLSHELVRYENLRVKTYIDIKSYKGWRHLKGYPVRGQRTRSNSSSQELLYRSRLSAYMQNKNRR